jgi:hypothetical protein
MMPGPTQGEAKNEPTMQAHVKCGNAISTPSVAITRTTSSHPGWQGGALVTVSLLAMFLAGCGAAGASHSDPAGAVNGLEQAWANNNPKGAADWIAPSQRNAYLSDLTDNQSLGGSLTFTVTNFQVTSVSMTDSSHATAHVSTDFQMCPAQQSLLSSCQSFAQMAEHTSGANGDGTATAALESGQWYVSYP